jgi:integrase/recombinase XerD
LPVPTEAELARLLAQPDITQPVGIRDRALLEVAYGCGLRRGELVRLTIFDPDFQRGTLRVLGKGRKERIVPLGRQALHWLKRYLQHARPKLLGGRLNEEALWISGKHRPLGGMGMRQQLWEYSKRAQIKTLMCLHSLRRACATHMLRHGAHPVQIQMLLGHASLKHLSQYLEVTITDLRKTHRQSKPGK